MNDSKILVTGGTGFIGGNLVEELISRGEHVRCLVRKQSIGKIQHLKELGAEIVFGELSDIRSIKNAMNDIEKVYHLAAIPHPMPISRQEYFKINVAGTTNILEACISNGIKRTVYISTISAVGPTRDGNPVDENTPCRPIDVYGESKLASEKVVMEFFEKYKLPIVIVRFPNVFGPRDLTGLKLFKAINTGLFPVLGQGRARFEFTYVKNLVPGIISAMEKGRPGEVYHLTDGRTYRIREVYDAIAKEEGKRLLYVPIPVIFFKIMGYMADKIERLTGIRLPANSTTIMTMTSDFWVVNIEKAKRELGFEQKIPLEQAIKETVEWYRDNGYM